MFMVSSLSSHERHLVGVVIPLLFRIANTGMLFAIKNYIMLISFKKNYNKMSINNYRNY